MLIGCTLVLFLIGIGLSHGEKPRSKFSDYSIPHIYKGKPAKPVLSKDQRTFRTMIRRGANQAVEFGGHYTVPIFGCGSGCTDFYVVDSISGFVYDGFAVIDLPGAWLEKHDPRNFERLEFHPNSRLLKINGCPHETACGFYDYVIVDRLGLKLVRKELLPEEFQP